MGPSFAYSPSYALDNRSESVLANENLSALMADFWMDVYVFGRYPITVVKQLKSFGFDFNFEEGDYELLIKGKPDFMGVNYYQSMTVTDMKLDEKIEANRPNYSGKKGSVGCMGFPGIFKSVHNETLEYTNWDRSIDPQGLRVALRRIANRYYLPVLINENGLGEYDTLLPDNEVHDDYRIDYLRKHISAVQDAITDGVEVLGYCTWSFTDLLSWLNGYQKRYGFVYVDRNETDTKELRRFKKDSFYWYQKVIETNGEHFKGD